MATPAERPTPQNAKRVLAIVKGSTTASARDLEVARDEALVWPHLLYREAVAAMAVVAFLWLLSLALDIPLGGLADPRHSPNPAKAPWYFLFLQESLVYFDPWLAGVIVPGIIVAALVLIPYLDPGTEGTGEYTWRKRPFAVSFFALGMVMWGVLSVIGRFLRGPSWAWYWPWESWEIHKEAVLTRNLPLWVGVALVVVYLVLGMTLPAAWKRDFYRKLGMGRYVLTMFFVLSMLGLLGKVALRIFFQVKYVIVTPWFNV